MKAAVIAHRDEALLAFTNFIKKLQVDLLDYYYSGTWVNDSRGGSLTQAFVFGMVDRILLHFAGAYYSPDRFTSLAPSFVLVTERPRGSELTQLPYPVDEDLLGDNEIIRQNFCGSYPAIFDRLVFLYAVPAPEQAYAMITTSIENLINLVLAGLFSRMERGEFGDSDPSKIPSYPPARVCMVNRVQDVNVDARLVIGADFVWIPVVPHGKFMSEVMDTILGYEEPEEKPIPPWEPIYEDLKLSDLTEAQITAAKAMNKGPIHGAYRENDSIFVIMKNDLDHIYEWAANKPADGGGKWVPSRERMVYPRLIGSGVKVYRF